MNDILSEKEINALQEILGDVLEIASSQITAESRIKADLGADSLDVIEIGMAVEEQFEVSIPDEAMEQISTVSDLYESLAKLLEQRDPTRECGRYPDSFSSS